jgi:hypothetical protein
MAELADLLELLHSVALNLEGTTIDMFSVELDAESPVKLATRLVPAPEAAPEI